MRQFAQTALLLLLAGGTVLLPAQTRTDSLEQALALLGELTEDGNYEQAQVDAENLRDYLRASSLPYPADAVPLFLNIYRKNRDKKSARAFLDEAFVSIQNHTDTRGEVELLAALAEGYSDWGRPENALVCLQRLAAMRDTLAERERRADLAVLQQRLDSLAQARTAELPQPASDAVVVQRDILIAIGALVAVLFVLLVWLNRRNNRDWQKLLAKRDLELEFLRSERYSTAVHIEPTSTEIAVSGKDVAAYEQAAYIRTGERRPNKTALLIEPNRQIVLYLKSLLADRFEVETALASSEGLLAASNHLPDLIVCDAVLNGQTGIDVVRQIKLAERTNHIPVILLTERSGNEGKLDALRAGADAWFARPVLDHELDASVTLLLDAHLRQHEDFARFLHLYFSENRISVGDPFVAKVVDAIEQNLSDPDFMADHLAKKMQLHKQHFFKKLHVLTGKEPAQLLREMRLEKARSLLEIRAGTPQTISELVGFSNAGTFALAFKEYFGENTLLLRMPAKEQ
ncbi:MAG: helix-turn-helix domain-containing protein [Saprospiraceae bacterium]